MENFIYKWNKQLQLIKNKLPAAAPAPHDIKMHGYLHVTKLMECCSGYHEVLGFCLWKMYSHEGLDVDLEAEFALCCHTRDWN